jgi:hypothetical protein
VATITLNQKAYRVVLLMMGMRHPGISTVLGARGFNDAEMARGYYLLFKLTSGRFGMTDFASLAKPIDLLDAWENVNYPIIYAVLEHHHPEACAEVFQNLSQTEGAHVIASTNTLLERLATQPAEVHATLASRGVTPEVLAEGRGYLDQLAKLVPATKMRVDAKADAAAEKALWAWYKEWSTIARTEIKSRKLLRLLGFLKRPSGEVVEAPLPGAPDDDESDEDESTERDDDTQRTQPQEPQAPQQPQQPVAPVVDPPPPGRNEPPPFE